MGKTPAWPCTRAASWAGYESAFENALVELRESGDFILDPAPVVVTGTVKFTPTVLNLNSSADLCARVELEPGYDPGQVDLTSLALESDLGGVGAERAEVREGLLWVCFGHQAVASILTVGDDLTLTIRGTIGTVELAAVGHLRVVAPRRAK